MGLDMYLEKRTYVKNWDHMSDEQKTQITVTRSGKPVQDIKPERITYIIEEVAYWRKANAIHRWFVENVQDGVDDCGYYYVSRKQLEELLEICKRVRDESVLVPGQVHVATKWTLEGGEEHVYEEGKIVGNPDIAQELLPTQDGFFFGSTNYDEWYFNDIDYTIRTLEAILKEEGDGSFYYNSSW